GVAMDFRLSPEQQQFRDSVSRFSGKELSAGALDRAHDPKYPWDVAKKMAQQGLLGITIAEADVVQAGNFGPIRVLSEYGSSFQKQTFLSRLLKGEAVISVGMTENEAGSAVTDLTTKATRDGKGWRVNGSKIFTTHSAYADLVLTYVRFGPGVGGIGSVLIESKQVRRGRKSHFMSGEEWAELHFDNVFVPEEMVLLGEGGFKKQIAGFNVE